MRRRIKALFQILARNRLGQEGPRVVMAALNRTAVAAHRERGGSGQVARPSDRSVVSLDAAMGKTKPEQIVGLEGATGQQEKPSDSRPDLGNDARHQRGIDRQADSRCRDAHSGSRGGQPDVAHQSQDATGPEGWAVDPRHDGQGLLVKAPVKSADRIAEGPLPKARP
jgi:hypothetical protein